MEPSSAVCVRVPRGPSPVMVIPELWPERAPYSVPLRLQVCVRGYRRARPTQVVVVAQDEALDAEPRCTGAGPAPEQPGDDGAKERPKGCGGGSSNAVRR
jgi:hypothetical protein